MPKEKAAAWKTARKLCRLDDTEVRMAEKLGITPEKALAMRPDPKESWKDPAALRIRRLYDKAFGGKDPLLF